MLTSEGIVENEDLNQNTELSSDGVFTLIQNEDSNIKIHQDYNGSMELYIYMKRMNTLQYQIHSSD